MIGAHRGKYPIFRVLGAASSAHAGKYPILTDFKPPLLYPHFGSGVHGFSVFAQISRHRVEGPAIPQWVFVGAGFGVCLKKFFKPPVLWWQKVRTLPPKSGLGWA